MLSRGGEGAYISGAGSDVSVMESGGQAAERVYSCHLFDPLGFLPLSPSFPSSPSRLVFIRLWLAFPHALLQHALSRPSLRNEKGRSLVPSVLPLQYVALPILSGLQLNG